MNNSVSDGIARGQLGDDWWSELGMIGGLSWGMSNSVSDGIVTG